MIRGAVLQDVDLRTVVLVGGRDFGRCPLAARLPMALWPIGDKPVLVRLLDRLADEGVRAATVCCADDISAAVRTACEISRLETALLVEELTAGTAGCLRDAASGDPGDLIMVLSGSTVALPSVEGLIEAHQASDADLTMVFSPTGAYETSRGSSAEIFLCHPRILAHIPVGGYSDIKETLIPSLLRAGGVVRPAVLDHEVGSFHDRSGYLHGLNVFFRDLASEEHCVCHGPCDSEVVVRGPDADVHPSARLCGPVMIGDRARIAEGAAIIGPATIGSDAVLGANSVVVRSALWAHAEVGAQCEIRESVLADSVVVPDGSQVVEEAVVVDAWNGPSVRTATPSESHNKNERAKVIRSRARRLPERLFRWSPHPVRDVSCVFCGVAILAALLWSYWPTIANLMQVWQRSDEYSSGLLVPFLAAYAVWSRRQDLRSVSVWPAVVAGISAFVFAQMVRGMGLYFMTQAAERLSLVLTATALVLLMLGWKYLGKLWPVLLFLCLMLPWPNRIQSAIALPLQGWSTTSAVFCLELVGYGVVRDGNVIHIGGSSVAVAEACNGLRMITAFFVISGLVALLTKRAWWEKLIILISSLPIAFLCNTLRLAVTAMFFTVLEGEAWERRFHDWGGYAMMPLALAIVIGELWLLAQLTIPPEEVESTIISRRQPQHVADP